MECLAGFCWNPKFKKPYASAERPADKKDEPYDLGLRTEHLLRVTFTQREKLIARLTERNDARLGALGAHPHLLVFEADDMREVMNDWKKHPETWSDSLSALNDMETNQKYHLSKHSKFSTMLFQLFGNKSLVKLFVQYVLYRLRNF